MTSWIFEFFVLGALIQKTVRASGLGESVNDTSSYSNENVTDPEATELHTDVNNTPKESETIPNNKFTVGLQINLSTTPQRTDDIVTGSQINTTNIPDGPLSSNTITSSKATVADVTSTSAAHVISDMSMNRTPAFDNNDGNIQANFDDTNGNVIHAPNDTTTRNDFTGMPANVEYDQKTSIKENVQTFHTSATAFIFTSQSVINDIATETQAQATEWSTDRKTFNSSFLTYTLLNNSTIVSDARRDITTVAIPITEDIGLSNPTAAIHSLNISTLNTKIPRHSSDHRVINSNQTFTSEIHMTKQLGFYDNLTSGISATIVNVDNTRSTADYLTDMRATTAATITDGHAITDIDTDHQSTSTHTLNLHVPNTTENVTNDHATTPSIGSASQTTTTHDATGRHKPTDLADRHAIAANPADKNAITDAFSGNNNNPTLQNTKGTTTDVRSVEQTTKAHTKKGDHSITNNRTGIQMTIANTTLGHYTTTADTTTDRQTNTPTLKSRVDAYFPKANVSSTTAHVRHESSTVMSPSTNSTKITTALSHGTFTPTSYNRSQLSENHGQGRASLSEKPANSFTETILCKYALTINVCYTIFLIMTIT